MRRIVSDIGSGISSVGDWADEDSDKAILNREYETIENDYRALEEELSSLIKPGRAFSTIREEIQELFKKRIESQKNKLTQNPGNAVDIERDIHVSEELCKRIVNQIQRSEIPLDHLIDQETATTLQRTLDLEVDKLIEHVHGQFQQELKRLERECRKPDNIDLNSHRKQWQAPEFRLPKNLFDPATLERLRLAIAVSWDAIPKRLESNRHQLIKKIQDLVNKKSVCNAQDQLKKEIQSLFLDHLHDYLVDVDEIRKAFGCKEAFDDNNEDKLITKLKNGIKNRSLNFNEIKVRIVNGERTKEKGVVYSKIKEFEQKLEPFYSELAALVDQFGKELKNLGQMDAKQREELRAKLVNSVDTYFSQEIANTEQKTRGLKSKMASLLFPHQAKDPISLLRKILSNSELSIKQKAFGVVAICLKYACELSFLIPAAKEFSPLDPQFEAQMRSQFKARYGNADPDALYRLQEKDLEEAKEQFNKAFGPHPDLQQIRLEDGTSYSTNDAIAFLRKYHQLSQDDPESILEQLEPKEVYRDADVTLHEEDPKERESVLRKYDANNPEEFDAGLANFFKWYLSFEQERPDLHKRAEERLRLRDKKDQQRQVTQEAKSATDSAWELIEAIPIGGSRPSAGLHHRQIGGTKTQQAEDLPRDPLTEFNGRSVHNLLVTTRPRQKSSDVHQLASPQKQPPRSERPTQQAYPNSTPQAKKIANSTEPESTNDLQRLEDQVANFFLGRGALLATSTRVLGNNPNDEHYQSPAHAFDANHHLVKRTPGNWDTSHQFIALAEGSESDFKAAIKRGDARFDTIFFDNLIDQKFWDTQRLPEEQKKKINKLRGWLADKEVISNIKTDGSAPLFSRMSAPFLDWLLLDQNRVQAIKAEHVKNIRPESFSTLSDNSFRALLSRDSLAQALTNNQAGKISLSNFSDPALIAKFFGTVNNDVFFYFLKENGVRFHSMLEQQGQIPAEIRKQLLRLTNSQIQDPHLNPEQWSKFVFSDLELANHIIPKLTDSKIHALPTASLQHIHPETFRLFSGSFNLFRQLSLQQKPTLTTSQYAFVAPTDLNIAVNSNPNFFQNMDAAKVGEVCCALTDQDFASSNTVKSYMDSIKTPLRGFDALRWITKLPKTHLARIQWADFEQIHNSIILGNIRANLEKYTSLNAILNFSPDQFNFFNIKWHNSINWNAIFSSGSNQDLKSILDNSDVDRQLRILSEIAQKRYTVDNDNSLFKYIDALSVPQIDGIIDYAIRNRASNPPPRVEVHPSFVKDFDLSFIEKLGDLELTHIRGLDHLIQILITDNNVSSLSPALISSLGMEHLWFWRSLAHFTLYKMDANQVQNIRNEILVELAKRNYFSNPIATPLIEKLTPSQCQPLQNPEVFNKLSTAHQDIVNRVSLQPQPRPAVPQHAVQVAANKNLRPERNRGAIVAMAPEFGFIAPSHMLPEDQRFRGVNKIVFDDIFKILTEGKEKQTNIFFITTQNQGGQVYSDYYKLSDSIFATFETFAKHYSMAAGNAVRQKQLYDLAYNMWRTSWNHWSQMSPADFPAGHIDKVRIAGHGNPTRAGGLSYDDATTLLQSFFSAAEVERYWFAMCKTEPSLGVELLNKIIAARQYQPKEIVGSSTVMTSTVDPADSPNYGISYKNGQYQQQKGHDYKWRLRKDGTNDWLVGYVYSPQDGSDQVQVRRFDADGNLRGGKAEEFALNVVVDREEARKTLERLGPDGYRDYEEAQMRQGMQEAEDRIKRWDSLGEELAKAAKQQIPGGASDKILDLDTLKSGSLEVTLRDLETGQAQTARLPDTYQAKVDEFAPLHSEQKEAQRVIGTSLDVTPSGSFTLRGVDKASGRIGKGGSIAMGTAFALLAWQKFFQKGLKALQEKPLEFQVSAYNNLLSGATGISQDLANMGKNLFLKVASKKANVIFGLRGVEKVLKTVNFGLAVTSVVFDGVRLIKAQTAEERIDAGLGMGGTTATLLAGSLFGGTVGLGVAGGFALLQYGVSLYDQATEESQSNLDFFSKYGSKLTEKKCTIEDNKFICKKVQEIDFEKKQITSGSEKISSDRTYPFQHGKDLYEVLGVDRVQKIEAPNIPTARVLPATTKETVFFIDPLIGSHMLTGADVKVSAQGAILYKKLVEAGVIRGPLSTDGTIKYTPADLQQRENPSSLSIKMDAVAGEYSILDSAGSNQASYQFTANDKGGAALIDNFHHGVILALADHENLLEPSQFLIQVSDADLFDEESLKIETQGEKTYITIKNNNGQTSKIDISGITESSVGIVGKVGIWTLDLIEKKPFLTAVSSFGKNSREALQRQLKHLENRGFIVNMVKIDFSDKELPSRPALPSPRIEKQPRVTRSGDPGPITIETEITTTLTEQTTKTVETGKRRRFVPRVKGGPPIGVLETTSQITLKTVRTPKTDPLVQEYEVQKARYVKAVKDFYRDEVISTFYDDESDQCVGLNAPRPLPAGSEQIPGTRLFFDPKTSKLRHISGTQRDLLPFDQDPAHRNSPIGIQLLIPHKEGKITDLTVQEKGFSFKHEIPHGENGKTITFSYTWKDHELFLTEVHGLSNAQLEKLVPPTPEEARQIISNHAQSGTWSRDVEHPVNIPFRGHRITGTFKIHNGRIESKVQAVTNVPYLLTMLFSPENLRRISISHRGQIILAEDGQRIQVHTPDWMKFQGISGESGARFINSQTGKVINSAEGNLKPTDELIAELKFGEEGGLIFHSPQDKTVLFVKVAPDGTMVFHPRRGQISNVSLTQDHHSVILTLENGKELRQWNPFNGQVTEIPVQPVRIPTTSIYKQEMSTKSLNYNFGFHLLPGASWKAASREGEQIIAIQKVPYGKHKQASLELTFITTKSADGKIEAQLEQISGLTKMQLDQLREQLRLKNVPVSAAIATFLGSLIGTEVEQIKVTDYLKFTDRFGQQSLLLTKNHYLIDPLKGKTLNIEGGGHAYPAGDFEWIESGARGQNSWHYAWSPTGELRLARWDGTSIHIHPRHPGRQQRKSDRNHHTHLLSKTRFQEPIKEADGSYRYVTEDGRNIYHVDPQTGHLKLSATLEVLPESEEDDFPIHFHSAMENAAATTGPRNSSIPSATTSRLPIIGRPVLAPLLRL
ncbi:MAG: hypothetical protein C5B47_06080 [Verrucomicrobia bacterium]|nr:MAG: hypothetical protein C5B47_06080 [Verrucomicrobiota bacterium]